VEFFFTKNNITVLPHPSYFSVSPTEDKTEKPPTTEVIKAESQAVLIPGALGTVHMNGRGLLKG
jgi:hypothetical protein